MSGDFRATPFARLISSIFLGVLVRKLTISAILDFLNFRTCQARFEDNTKLPRWSLWAGFFRCLLLASFEFQHYCKVEAHKLQKVTKISGLWLCFRGFCRFFFPLLFSLPSCSTSSVCPVFLSREERAGRVWKGSNRKGLEKQFQPPKIKLDPLNPNTSFRDVQTFIVILMSGVFRVTPFARLFSLHFERSLVIKD